MQGNEGMNNKSKEVDQERGWRWDEKRRQDLEREIMRRRTARKCTNREDRRPIISKTASGKKMSKLEFFKTDELELKYSKF